MAGFLMKYGTMNNWRKHYVVVAGTSLECFKSKVGLR